MPVESIVGKGELIVKNISTLFTLYQMTNFETGPN